MSKAFTREDDRDDAPVLPRPASPLPPGVKNYLTPDGARRLREELTHLSDVDRPLVAARPEEESARRQLHVIDQRLDYLQASLRTAEVVRPPAEPPVQVRFGTTVTVRDSRGRQQRYRIVGVDETDTDRGWVSWRSPVATALLKSRVGDCVLLRSPEGDEALDVLDIVYE
ncbi:MAG: GreA/GreB family elongation factor [Lentisphaerae bacterium]|nr:GreA/GreB family elongation factor [Lentisphaerota bacterium]